MTGGSLYLKKAPTRLRKRYLEGGNSARDDFGASCDQNSSRKETAEAQRPQWQEATQYHKEVQRIVKTDRNKPKTRPIEDCPTILGILELTNIKQNTSNAPQPEALNTQGRCTTSEAPEALQGQMSPQSDLWSVGHTQSHWERDWACLGLWPAVV